MRNKYRNTKVTVGCEAFDSKKEANRWLELVQMEKSGKISNLRRQVKYVLIPSQRQCGKVIERECSYYADFVYMFGNVEIVEDAKGIRTKDYIIKRKLMLWVHGIKIQEV